MTKQEYYDLLIQCSEDGTFPSSYLGECLYRGEGKQKCAVGILIPDDKYDPRIEGQGLDQDIFDLCDVPEGLTMYDLQSIQESHDTCDLVNFQINFIHKINKLPCFKEVTKIDPTHLR